MHRASKLDLSCRDRFETSFRVGSRLAGSWPNKRTFSFSNPGNRTMAQDPVEASWQQLAQIDLRLAEHIETLEAQTATLDQASFDPSTGDPVNAAGSMVSNLSLVADELRELRSAISSMRRLRLQGERSRPRPVPHPLIWIDEADGSGKKLEDPSGHWHARIWRQDRTWRWDLASGYGFALAIRLGDEDLGESAAMRACEGALGKLGWPVSCLPELSSPKPSEGEAIV